MMKQKQSRREMAFDSLRVLNRAVADCRRCPELREYCSKIAAAKRKSYVDWKYWGRPVPSFGDERARIMIAGLAPAAHGANRTGRMFTGDRSGDFLYAALHRAGMANQPKSTHKDDGLKLRGVYITAAARCAPPANKPTPSQLANCAAYLDREFQIIRPAVVICLGAIAWNAALPAVARLHDAKMPSPRPRFAHGGEVEIGSTILLGCYHVSQQNTFTVRLTPAMIDAVLHRAAARCGLQVGAGTVRATRR